MLPCASFLAPCAVKTIELACLGWHAAHTGVTRVSPGLASAAAGCCANAVDARPTAIRLAPSAPAVNLSRIGFLPPTVQSDPNRIKHLLLRQDAAANLSLAQLQSARSPP